MRDDPVVEEVRRERQAHAARFQYDLRAISLDLKKQEQESGKKLVRYPPCRLEPALAAPQDKSTS